MTKEPVYGLFSAYRFPRLPKVISSILRCVLCSSSLLCLFAGLSRAQNPCSSASSPNHLSDLADREPGELFFEGYVATDTFKFGAGEVSSSIDYAGVEYDRHSSDTHCTFMGRVWKTLPDLLHARVSYVFEALPLVLIRQPVVTDIYGDALTPARKLNPGIEIAPLGFRWQWRDRKAIRPYWVVKLGESVFLEKALAIDASYENFMINSAAGIQARINHKADLRLGYAFQHVSNAYSNADPGLDTLGISFGIVYHFPSSSRW
ncbi:MAG: acyloxyacyl hydrolase [Acidobacteriota bacterium]